MRAARVTLLFLTACHTGRLIPTAMIAPGRPAYPDSLRAAGVQGRVIVQVIVDTAGRSEPGSAAVIESTHPGFDQPAVAFVMAARFRPARFHERQIRAMALVPVAFRLDARNLGDVFRADEVDAPPVILSAKPPRYPAGVPDSIPVRVVVSCVIDTLGRAEPVSLHVVSSPGAAFEKPARAYVLDARFRAGLLGGRRVRVLMDVPVDFQSDR